MPDYRDFYYPLNVLLHVLTLEEGDVRHLHYGLFERADEAIGTAQERASTRILSQLPPPPARVLDVGSGLGTTLERLVLVGYDALGITPDENQIALIRKRYGDDLPLQCVRFEDLDVDAPFDVALFHESTQYIDSEALFAKAERIARTLLVLDEFAMRPVKGLHRYDDFLAAAQRHHFSKVIDEDVSEQAAPTVDYFVPRLPRFQQRLIDDVGVTDAQIDDLIESGKRYRDRYRSGEYGYRFLRFDNASRIPPQ
jgi:SAM-dependent methyltransferase